MKVTETFSMDRYNFWLEQSNKADVIILYSVMRCLNA